jgi:hypothetical protein
MANTTKKIVDPTEAALSAIQEALNIPNERPPANRRQEEQFGSASVGTGFGGYAERQHDGEVPQASARTLFDVEPIGVRGSDPRAAAANDDQQSIGQVLQALQQRPSRTPYFVAALLSAVWGIACAAFTWAYSSNLNIIALPGHSSAAVMVGLAAAAILPLIFFFALAHMAWRGQELRLVAQSMAKLAMRLAEPETNARDTVVTVGQAIRREVAAMGDGVERALARASELEVLVQNEVAALERTYRDNEVRMRGLLQELTNERDTLVGQAEQVRSAISNVHIDLTQDLSTISELVGQQVTEAAERITHSLSEKGEQITLALGQIGDSMIRELSDRGEDLLVRLEGASNDTANAIAAASDQLTAGLNFKTDHIGDEFSEIARGLEDMMASRLDRVADGFSERSLAIIDTMVGRSQELTDAIVNTSSRLAETMAIRADEVNATIRASGESVVLDLGLRGGDVAKKFEQAGARMTEELVARSSKLQDELRDNADRLVESLNSRTLGATDSLRESTDRVAKVVAAHSEQLREMLSTRLAAFEETLTHSGAELGEKIARDSSTLGNLITRHLAEFDRTVKTYGSELVERLGARTQDVTETMRAYVDNFDNRVTAKAGEIAGGLDQRLVEFQQTIDSRTQTLTDAMAARVLDVAKTLTEGGREVVAAVEKRIADVTAVIDARGANLADTVTRRTADASEALDATGVRVVNAINQRVVEAATILDGSGTKLAETVGRRLAEATAVLEGSGAKLVETVEHRTNEAMTVIDTRGANLAETLAARTAEMDKAIGAQALRVANTLDGRISHLEELLVGRAEAVSREIDQSSRAAADLLNTRIEELSKNIKANSSRAEEAISQLATRTVEALGKSATASVAATEALNRSAAEATVSLNRSAGTLSNTIGQSAVAANEAISNTTATATQLIARAAAATSEAIERSSGEAERRLGDFSAELARSAAATGEVIGQSAGEAERKLTAISTELARTAAAATEAIGDSAGEAARKLSGISADLARSAASTTEAIERSAGEAESRLAGLSAEVARNVTGKAGEIATTVSQQVGEMSRILDEKAAGLLTAFSSKGQQFAGEVDRITEQAVKSIEAKSFVFTQTMMDNSEAIARLVNEASENATVAMTRTLGQLQEGAEGVTEAAKSTITRTLENLQSATKSAIEESRQTATATVADMLETHGMLRSDTTALFERLREANILLQEVLSGAHENMSSLERTMVNRVSEFVAAMNDLSSKTDTSSTLVERHLGTFNAVTSKALRELGELATQFGTHGRTLAQAVELLDNSSRRAEESVAARGTNVEVLISTLDTRTEDFGQRLQRFSGLLDESLNAASARTREIAGIIAESSNTSVQTIERQFTAVRTASEQERKRTSEALGSIYNEATAQAQTLLNQSAERFGEIMRGMKQMAAEMQKELETTRADLRRGIVELPQETAESAAQMRRVIVEQIEALAELNRIVARHGRSLDTVEPTRAESRREPEVAFATAGRAPQQFRRSDVAAAPPPRSEMTGAPPRRNEMAAAKVPLGGGNGRNGGWLSELLTRASREDSPSIAPPSPRAGARGEGLRRDEADTLETLAVDVARLVDHEAAAELWERYNRGERDLFSRRLYTPHGQKAFEEIRGKYRSDTEFRQTVEQYIREFERLLEDVSRGERGAAVARNYLISDTGKVYTMLAHAAGRFDQ